MSTFPVRAFTDTSRPDAPNHRLSIIRWKATKDEAGKVKSARSALYVSVPKISLSVTPAILANALSTKLEEMQDSFIRSRIEADFESGLQLPKSFDISDLTPEALAAWASEEAISGKLSKELINEWFLSSGVKETLEEKFSLIEGMTDEKLAKSLRDYQEGLAKLASPQASMPVLVAEQLSKAISFGSDDKVKAQLTKKLDKFLNPQTTSIEALL